MKFLVDATTKEIEHAFAECKKIIYKNKKRFLCRGYFEEKGKYKWAINCPCGDCDWSEYLDYKIGVDDIKNFMKKLLMHLTFNFLKDPTYEHLKLSEKIFGKGRTKEEVDICFFRLRNQTREVDKYLFLSEEEDETN